MNVVRACPWRGGVRRPDLLQWPVGRRAPSGTHTSSWPRAPFLPSKGGSPCLPTQRRPAGVSGALAWMGAVGREGQLTREEEPELAPEALRDALQHQLPRSCRAVHAHATSELEEVDVPRLLFHLLLGLGEPQTGGLRG